ncbi:MAG: 50S ribosome-binding GTPase [Planctomycetes bacterium]|nr:50S ribosome-binding GTPase [Planctomycetota bacterium]
MSEPLRLLTPNGRGGIAVLAATGPDRLSRLAPLLRRRDGGAPSPGELAGRGPWLVVLVIDGEPVDDVVFVDRPAFGSAELQLHAAPTLITELIARGIAVIESAAASPAERLMRDAIDERQLALALEQRALDGVEAALERLCGVERTARRAELVAMRERSVVALALAHPRRIVLFGPQNAGKSTLFNRLVLHERALAGPHAGLTRDAVLAVTILDGYPCELADTAGEGGAVDAIDAQAQARSRALREGALRGLVCDASRPMGPIERSLLCAADCVVLNKRDLGMHPSWSDPACASCVVACSDEADAFAVRDTVGTMLRVVRGLPVAPLRGVGGVAALDARELRLIDDALAKTAG